MARTPRSPLTPDQTDRVDRYRDYAASLAKPLAKAYPAEAEDFAAEAQLALVQAAQSFDQARNVDFSTFARRRIRGALCDALDALDPITITTGRACPDPVDPAPPVGAELESADEVEAWLRKLPSQQQVEVCREVYLRGRSIPGAAFALGLSPAHAGILHSEALDFLRSA